jgi:tRNA A-37 threonylcarbamoyl transferase component Bud32
VDWPDKLLNKVGAGGFASVWSVLGQRVIKIAHVSHDLARARIAREAEALAAIGAPAVPAYVANDVGTDGRAWIVMEQIDGQTLAELIAAGPIALADVLAIARGTLDALEAIHTARYVHRDLKPANIVRKPDGTIAILDLGLARKLPDDPDDPTRAKVQVGSLEYMSPEQLADSAAVDERSDLYAFGCVLYALCTGRPPFVGDAAALERAHAALRPPRLGALATVPPALEALTSDLLAKDRARRPPSVAAVRARLAEARAGDEPNTRSVHSISLIGHGNQPVVLVFAELPKVDRALLSILAARRLVVISQRGRRVLASVLGGDHADPATVAIATARDLAAAGAAVALHLEALRIETVAGVSTVHGEAVDKPETWLPARPWTGVVLSRSLATVTQVATRDSDLGDGWRELAEEQTDAQLFGREALLTDLAADAAAALAGTGPALALLVGDAGVGKTAFAHELARRVADLDARVHIATIPAPGTGKPSQSALEDLVGVVPAGTSLVRAVGDALREVARQRPLAVILDDLHLADHDLIDALEYATLGGERLPLWVLGVAAPRLETKRPQLGVRAERHRRDVLPALDHEAAIRLAAKLLRPAEYPPVRALRRLAEIARGNPLHLSMLAREIHERGAIRERPGGAPFLDTTALDDLPPAALGPWLAARELGPLSAELVALARVCAVLGGEFARTDLTAIAAAVEARGGATTTIDVGVGLAELERAGVIASSEHGYRFRQALVEEGIYATTNEVERRALHEAALAYFGDAARVARHAEGAGACDVAGRAYAQLGERAYREHRQLEADEAFSAAIRQLDTHSAARAEALVGRARARYTLQRIVDAQADLDEAIASAKALDDAALEIDALLARSTVLDWAEDFAGSAAAAAAARERLPRAATPAREAEVLLAEARAAFRAADRGGARHEDVVAALSRARAAAHAIGRVDIAVIAGVLLGPTLAWLHDPSAEQVFAEVIAECEQAGDRLHLGAAYANRAWLWGELGKVERTHEDLRQVIQIARELGQATLERIGTHNLAEELLWLGALGEALQLARRCYAIQRAHGEATTIPDRMLLARVLAARGDAGELAQFLNTLAADPLSTEDAIVVDCLRGNWDALARAGDSLSPPIRIEVAHLAARAGRLDDAARAAIRELARSHPIWQHRLDEL